MADVRVLVVEDDAAINEIVATHLARHGMACTQAFSGSEARLLVAADPFPFDVVISDLMLPGLSGEELVALIRERDAQVPIIVISARTATSDRIDLLKLGADDYLTKPFDLNELVARIEVQLRHRGVGARSSSCVPLLGARPQISCMGARSRGAHVLGGRRARGAYAHRVQHPRGADLPSAARVLQAGPV